MGAVIAKCVFKSGDEAVRVSQRGLKEMEMLDIDGQMVYLGNLMDEKKVILFVNVATK